MKFLYTFFFILFTCQLSGQSNRDSIDLNFEQLDELTTKLMYGDQLFLDSQKLREIINIDRSYLPQYTDEEFRKQMSLIPTTIPLVYNEEIGTLIKYFVFKRREYVTRMLTHAQYYFPKFEERLDSRNMPIELRVLPIVESALNAQAKSRVGATGLWQIMHSTGQLLDLNINTLVDERSDPDLSTEAALTYLTKLYVLYNDWLLALAAYNSGPGRVNRAIRDAGGVYDFWKIRRFLPKETKNYVPSFIAMVFVMHYHKNFLLSPAKVKIDLHKVSTQKVFNQVSLKYIAELINEDEEMLKYLNPSLKKAIVPKTEEGFDLKIPIGKESIFLSRMNSLAEDPYIKKVTYQEPANTETVASLESQNGDEILESPNYKIIQKKTSHKVKRNENLQSIARRYNATMGELRKWNKLSKRSKLKIGQLLQVYVDVKVPIKKKNIEPSTAVNTDTPANTVKESEIAQPPAEAPTEKMVEKNNTKVKSKSITSVQQVTTTYKVKKGDNLSSIASKYNVTVKDIKSWNKLSSSRLDLGQTLKIHTKKRVVQVIEEPLSEEEIMQNATYFYHTVKAGETLYSLVRKYNYMSMSTLMSLNNFSKDTKLSVGDKVKISVRQ
jgi:membrane-bound lytic murein transglycosylase D